MSKRNRQGVRRREGNEGVKRNAVPMTRGSSAGSVAGSQLNSKRGHLFLSVHHLLALSNQLLCGLPDEPDSLQSLALAGYEGSQGGYLPKG